MKRLITLFLCLSLAVVLSAQVNVNLSTPCSGHIDTDWNKSGTTDAPDEITDTIFTFGNVGIGTTGPEHSLQILGEAGDDPFKVQELQEDSTLTRILVVTADGIVRYQNTASGNHNATGDHDFYRVGTTMSAGDINEQIYTLGNVGIGTTNPSHLLHVNGVARSTQSSWATSSDRRVKHDIQPIQSSLETLLQLNPVSFKWNETYRNENNLPTEQFGFIAQEVKEVVPRMVTTTTETVDGEQIEDFNLLNTSELTPLMVKSIQELHSRIEALEKENKELQHKLELVTPESSKERTRPTSETFINQITP